MFGKTLARWQLVRVCIFAAVVASSFLFAAVTTGRVGHFPNPVSTDATHTALTVTKLFDTNDGICNTDCSLREAIAAASPDNVIIFTHGLAGTITLVDTLAIRKNVAINGPENQSITISGNEAVRVFYVDSGVHFTIRNLIVTKGYVRGLPSASGAACEQGKAGGPAEGGGLYNDNGVVSVIHSTFSNNSAIGGTGGIGLLAPPPTCADHVYSGMGGNAFGGAVFSSGSISLLDSTFSGNRARGGSGGVGNITGVIGGRGGNGLGGALYAIGKAISVNSTFSNNLAEGGAAGPSLSGAAPGDQGGDGNGGALYATNEVRLINNTFSANQAKGGAGGTSGQDFYGRWISVSSAGDGGNGFGGAISCVSDAWISNCTFAGNAAIAGGHGYPFKGKSEAVGSGGAIYRPGGFPYKNTLRVNKAGTITIKNTLIANSSSRNNCEASMVSEGYNIDTDGTCGLTAPGDVSKHNPKLGPLKNNGGATFTHALLSGSPAIDAGNPAGCTDHNSAVIPTDQRGHGRSGRCDIGAFEFSR